MSEAKALFVTATGTGVGKTFVACAIAAALRASGRDVGVMKPVATGCRYSGDTKLNCGDKASRMRNTQRQLSIVSPEYRLESEDSRALIAASGASDAMELVTPVAFEPPLAPTAAARASGGEVDLARVLDAYRELEGRHEFLIVEGIGGLLVPLGDGYTVRELARDFGCPLVIVARDGLGTINHTALTVEAAASAGLEVRGVVLNRTPEMAADLSCATNAEEIERLAGVRVLARLGPSDGCETAARVFTDEMLGALFGGRHS